MAALPVPAAPETVQSPTFEAGVALVRVTVVVRDKTGALVRGLKREDFTITEDGKPQTIEAFEFESLSTEPSPEPEETTPAPRVFKPPPGAATPPPPPRAGSEPAPPPGPRLVALPLHTNATHPHHPQPS